MNILDEFDVSRFRLGGVCLRGHKYKGNDQSLRRRDTGACLACLDEKKEKKKKEYGKNNVCDICGGRPDHQLIHRIVNKKDVRVCGQCAKSFTTKQCAKCLQEKSIDSFNIDPRRKDGRKGSCKECENAVREKRRRRNGVKPKQPQYKTLGLLESFVGKVDEAQELVSSGIYYLGGVCSKGHDWHNTGYSLRFNSNTHCLACNKEQSERYKKENRDELRYQRWLKNPHVSLSVAGLVEKSEQWARIYRKELFMSPEEREEYNRRKREAYKKRYAENKEKEKLRIKIWKHSNPQRIDDHNKTRIERVRKASNGTVSKSVVAKILNSSSRCIYCDVPITAESATIDHIVPVSLGGAHADFNLVSCCRSCNSAKGNKAFHEWVKALSPKNKKKATAMYVKRYGAPPEQGLLPLLFN